MTEGGVPRPLADGTRIRLDFDGDQLGLEAGCNLHGFGNARQDGDRLIADWTSSTAMGCSSDRADQDEWVTRFLTSEPTLELDGDALRLTSEDVTIELLDIEVATPDQPLVGTQWRINTVIHDEGVNSYNEDAEAYLTFGDDGMVKGGTAIDIETSQLTLLAANNKGVSFRTV